MAEKNIKTCPHCEREHSTSYKTCKRCYVRISKYGDPYVASPKFGTGMTAETRFWSKAILTADSGKCWEWQASVTGGGYGSAYLNGKAITAHRLAWALANGREPSKGMWILHSCDNKLCINPNHLREGTPKDNTQDVMERNRWTALGEKHHLSVLNPEKVIQIRGLHSDGISQRKIAAMFGVDKGSIGCILKGRTWKHV